MFLFDKDRGADIFVRALGGVYNTIEVGTPTGFNPLQLPDTGENRAFLSRVDKNPRYRPHGEPFTSEDMERVNDAVNGNYKLKKDTIGYAAQHCPVLRPRNSRFRRRPPEASGTPHGPYSQNCSTTKPIQLILTYLQRFRLRDG